MLIVSWLLDLTKFFSCSNIGGTSGETLSSFVKMIDLVLAVSKLFKIIGFPGAVASAL